VCEQHGTSKQWSFVMLCLLASPSVVESPKLMSLLNFSHDHIYVDKRFHPVAMTMCIAITAFIYM
jgi:hypothetical protein